MIYDLWADIRAEWVRLEITDALRPLYSAPFICQGAVKEVLLRHFRKP